MLRRKSNLLLVLVVLMFAQAVSAVVGLYEDEPRPIYVPGEIIVKFRPEVSANVVNALAISNGASVERKLRLTNRNVYLVKVPSGVSEVDFIRQVEEDRDVIYAEHNTYVYLMDWPNDPNYAQQWALNNTAQWYPWDGRYAQPPETYNADINAPEGWEDVDSVFGTVGDPNIVIAIVDTGVDCNHPDLNDNMWTDANGFYGYDFINDDNDPNDDHGHGTHCAGIAAAVSDNGEYIAGIAWKCKIMAVKILNDQGGGANDHVIEGIDYAVQKHANVISMSLGATPSQSLHEAVTNAYNANCVLVASAGNDACNLKNHPAGYPEVMCVSATDGDDNIPYFSTYGNTVDVSAPGADILSLRAAGTDMYDIPGHGPPYYEPGDCFYPANNDNAKMYTASGTSMACPHVAGLAALCLSVDPNLTPDEVKCLIESSAKDLGDTGWDRYYGDGRIDVYETVHYVRYTPSKATDPVPQDNATNVTVNIDLRWNGASGTLSHDVYFGSTFNDVNDANTSSDEFMGNQFDNVFEQTALDPNSTYWWRIDEKNKHGTTKGDVWKFKTGLASGILYVDADAGSGGDGSSWSKAFDDDLQDALDYADTGDEIWVAEGTYKPTDGSDRSISFELLEYVDIYGGFDGTETSRDQRDWTTYESILSGDINQSGDANDNSYHVMIGADNAVLDGFTITGGNANGGAMNGEGGGMRNNFSQTVANCTFKANSAKVGGGLDNHKLGPIVTNCTFINNTATVRGAGMRNLGCPSLLVMDCTFIQNNVTDPNGMGGGMYNVGTAPLATVTSCIFIENACDKGRGGGMANGVLSSPNIKNCTFVGNSAIDGGGICHYMSLAGTTLTGCILWNNEASGYGDEIYNFLTFEKPDFSYCDVKGGINGSRCGGSDSNDVTGNINSDPSFANLFDFSDLTIADGNTITIKVEDASLYAQNDVIEYDRDGQTRTVTDVNTTTDIVWFASDALSADSEPNIIIYNWGIGVTDVDEDVHLESNSPCIDAGDPNFEADEDETDMDGEDRVMNGQVEMGTDEVCSCLGDLVATYGYITLADYSDLVDRLTDKGTPFIVYPGDPQWHPCGDMDEDGQMDLGDLSALQDLLMDAGPPYVVECE